jgi:hypothetical protein
MMVRSLGPVWHKKLKDKGIALKGVDQQATWSVSSCGWIYGHGSFSTTTHNIPVVGAFKWMKNSMCEAKRMRQEIWSYRKSLKYVCMDARADDSTLYYDLKKTGTQLVTVIQPRRGGKVMTKERRQMIRELKSLRIHREYQKRSITVEPMQGLMKNIFELERCWMRGNQNNRWLFASMGIAMQMAQLKAYRQGASTWCVKEEVLGL